MCVTSQAKRGILFGAEDKIIKAEEETRGKGRSTRGRALKYTASKHPKTPLK